MKILILIAVLLLCAAQMAVGQDTLTLGGLYSGRPYKLGEQTSFTMFSADSVWWHHPKEYFNIVALKWWDEWKDSCWVDSTVTFERQPCEWSEPGCGWVQQGDMITLMTNEKVRIVSRRNPDDLQGFFEFIRRRVE